MADDRHRAGIDGGTPLHGLRHLIEHAAHLLPSQGPITVFVHHNTLHAFEDSPFDEAVKKAGTTYGCHPYLAEDFYRGEVTRGRIPKSDLAAVLLEDLEEDADRLIGFMGTRYYLRLAMLEHPLRLGTEAELRWLIAETDALHRFREDAPSEVRLRMVEQTRQWVLRNYLNGRFADEGRKRDAVDVLLEEFNASGFDRWTDQTWEAFTLHLLWRVCHAGVHGVGRFVEGTPLPTRHRDLLLLVTGHDLDLSINEVLIPFCAAFLDQGFATWMLSGRAAGFFRSFTELYRDARPVTTWLEGLPGELRRIEQAGLSALESIGESLHLLGVGVAEHEEFITRSLLALRGWAGILRQMETNAEWAALPAPVGTLEQYLAVRLILERLALRQAAREILPDAVDLSDLRSALRHRISHPPRISVDQRAYLVFQLAQVRGWDPACLRRLSKPEWSRLIEEIESFGSLERRRIYHHAFERSYRNRALDALRAHSGRISERRQETSEPRPEFQFVCCLDEREESFRRHLEEVAPSCETFGVVGFFGVAMYYRGVTEAHYRPLCPINIKPRHYVREHATHSFENAVRLQTEARRRFGRMSHRLHVGSRSFVGGFLTGMVGSLATVPLLMRVLLPRRTARIRRLIRRMVVPPVTQLSLFRSKLDPGPDNGQLGYSIPEMADIVGGILRAMGFTGPFAPLAIIAGHGSSSLNNPQEAAYDCGACGGARGGPNARAFAQMANDARVRHLLAEGGLTIPDDVVFVGAYHNTCDDSLSYFDLDRLPLSHREDFDRARKAMDEARARNAHERCRRFRSAPLTLTTGEALRHVEGRAEDLSQTRPEYGHSTNAICYVGRRSRIRGLFLDRRAFLTSYDASRDDPEHSILAQVLRGVVPVCAGISLEYYFSTVDNSGYGCGTKLPHNIASLLGVMDGAMSDLRPGLSRQMIEIHEPLRILFIVENSPKAMSAVLAKEPAIDRLVRNGWVQLATLDPESSAVHCFRMGRFEPYEELGGELAVAPSSQAWYRGWREHLGFASIVAGEGGGIP